MSRINMEKEKVNHNRTPLSYTALYGYNVHPPYSLNLWATKSTKIWLRPTMLFVSWIKWNFYVQVLAPISIKFTLVLYPQDFIRYFNRVAIRWQIILTVLKKHKLMRNYPKGILLKMKNSGNQRGTMETLQTRITWQKTMFYPPLSLNMLTLKDTRPCGTSLENFPSPVQKTTRRPSMNHSIS